MPRRADGFTLLEIMVVVVVIGMIVATLTAGQRFGLMSWAHQSRAVARTDDLDTVDRAFRALVARIDPTLHRNEAPPVQGDSASLTVRTEMPEPVGALSTNRATATLAMDAGHRLVLSYTQYVNWTGTPPSPRESVLAEGVDHIELSYWQPKVGQAAAGWAREWRARTNPALIRLRIIFVAPGRRWPDIVAALMRQRPFGPA